MMQYSCRRYGENGEYGPQDVWIYSTFSKPGTCRMHGNHKIILTLTNDMGQDIRVADYAFAKHPYDYELLKGKQYYEKYIKDRREFKVVKAGHKHEFVLQVQNLSKHPEIIYPILYQVDGKWNIKVFGVVK